MNMIYNYCNEYINININWVDFLYEYEDDINNLDNYNKDDKLKSRIDKLIKKIKNLSWIDKPADENNDDNIMKDKQIERIINVFMSNDYNKSIGILLINDNEYYKRLTNKIIAIGDIFNYNCQIVNNVESLNKFDIIIPISSLLLDKYEIDKINVNKILFPTIHDYNIIRYENNEENKNIKSHYDFIHMIDNYIKHDEIIKHEYNYIIVK